MKHIACDDIQNIALRAGTLVLENGGETYRTEETVVHIAKSLGAKEADAFVTPTVVLFSYVDEFGHHHSCMHRVFTRGINLRRLVQVNNLSRRLEHRGKRSNPKQIEDALSRITAAADYPKKMVVLMAAASSAFFTLMFGGNAADAVCAFFIGLILRLMLIALERIPAGLNSFIISLLSGALVSVMADFIELSPINVTGAIVLIGTLMQVVPGLALVNSIRDVIGGDLMSGAARILDACMIAAGLSIGSVAGVFAAKITAHVLQTGGVSIPSVTTGGVLFAAFWSFGAAACCAFYYNTEVYDSVIGGILGSIGWVFFVIVSGQPGNDAPAYLAGAFAVALFSEILAVITKKPATVFLIPGLLPLVPGGGIFSMMRFAVQGQLDASLHTGYETLIAAGAIALGIALASSSARIGTLLRRYYGFNK